MSHLLSKRNQQAGQSRTQLVTPKSANWQYVGFEAHQLKAGESVAIQTGTDDCGSTKVSTSCVAIAASTALPPCARIVCPACAA